MECKACGTWFVSTMKTDLCTTCERAMKRLGFGNFSYDRLRELAQADWEGRCVVLPSVEYTEEDGENALKSAMHTCFYRNTPVTRYIADAVAEKLTREAAEKALEEMEETRNG